MYVIHARKYYDMKKTIFLLIISTLLSSCSSFDKTTTTARYEATDESGNVPIMVHFCLKNGKGTMTGSDGTTEPVRRAKIHGDTVIIRNPETIFKFY